MKTAEEWKQGDVVWQRGLGKDPPWCAVIFRCSVEALDGKEVYTFETYPEGRSFVTTSPYRSRSAALAAMICDAQDRVEELRRMLAQENEHGSRR